MAIHAPLSFHGAPMYVVIRKLLYICSYWWYRCTSITKVVSMKIMLFSAKCCCAMPLYSIFNVCIESGAVSKENHLDAKHFLGVPACFSVGP